MINVLKREQFLRDRGSTASRGTCGIRPLNIPAGGTVLQKAPLGRSRGMQQEWVEILEKALPRRKESKLLSERKIGIIDAEIPKWLLQGRK